MTESAEYRRLLRTGASRRRATLAVGLGAAITTFASAAQAVALTALVSNRHATDAFLSVYVLSLPASLLAFTFRGQLLPMFGDPENRPAWADSVRTITSYVTRIGVIQGLALVITAPLLVQVVVPDSAGHRGLALATLLVLAPVGALQFYAGALSAVLASTRRFEASSALYAGSSITGLAVSVALLPGIGPIGSAIGLLCGATLLATGHWLYLRRFQLSARPRLRSGAQRELIRLALRIVGYASIALVQPLLVAIAISALPEGPGQATGYTLAFFVIQGLLNITSVALGLVLLPDLVATPAGAWDAASARYLRRVAGTTLGIVMPVLVAVGITGSEAVERMGSAFLADAAASAFPGVISAFAVAAIGTILMQTCIAIAVARQRPVLVTGAAAVALLFQSGALVAVQPASAESCAWIQGATTTVVALMLLVSVRGGAWLVDLLVTLRRAAVGFAFALLLVVTYLAFSSTAASWMTLAIAPLMSLMISVRMRALSS